MALPNRVYRLAVYRAGDKLRWSEVGSKTYNSKKEAEKRLVYFRKRGIDCELYESEPIEWKQISTTETIEGQEELW